MKKRVPLKSALSHSRAGRKAAHGFTLRLAQPGQLAILDLPEVRQRMTAERRELAVQVAERLIAGGVSLNKSAGLLGLPVATLFYWLRGYRAGGFAALLPRRTRAASQRKVTGRQAPCRITFFLRK